MNLLVTGGAGFIGSNLIEHIIDRPEITRLVNLDCLTYAGHPANLATFANHPKHVFEKVDLRHAEEVRRVIRQHDITDVMHLAAESHVDRSITGPADFIHTNILGTFHLLEACRAQWLGGATPVAAEVTRRSAPDVAKNPPPHVGGYTANASRFLHVSTDEVYGSLGLTGVFSETSPYAPNSPYSASKASADMLVRAYHQTYGLPTVITNCSNNYGPRQFPEKLIPVVIQSVLAQKLVPIYGDGLHVREWLHVRDHAEALWQVLTRGRNGEIYNVGGGDELPNLRLAEMICDIIDELAPERGGNSRRLIAHVQDRPGHDRRYAIDASKIQRELGWKTSRPFADGLRETVRWYLENQSWVAAVTRSDRR